MIKVEKIETGYLKENCYVVSAKDECLVIDPGDDLDNILSLIGKRKVLAILITHYHFDHVGALDGLKNIYDVPVIDFKSYKNQKIGNFSFEIISTPGHKEDSVTYYFKEDNVMFTGDFLFNGTVGRCGLPGGNFKEMLKSIALIKEYDGDIILYPGHGETSTLFNEFKNNPYMKGDFNE